MQIGRTWQSDPRDLLLRPIADTMEDLEALAQVRNATLRAISLPEDFEDTDAEAIARTYNRPGFDLVDNAWLMFHEANPIAAAVLYPAAIFPDRPPGNFDMYVTPEFSRHGLGSRLLAHLEQAAVYRGYPVLETTIAMEDSLSTRFLTKRGFRVVGHAVHMARGDMQEIPTATSVEGFSLRSLLDLGEPAELYRDTANRLGAYDPNYSLIRPEEMEHMLQDSRWEPSGVLFLFDPDNRIVGVIRASGSKSMRGYLHEVRLEPASRGKGLGAFMIASALQYLRAADLERVELDTPGENTPAHNLALKAGFKVDRHWLHFLKPLSHDTAGL